MRAANRSPVAVTINQRTLSRGASSRRFALAAALVFASAHASAKSCTVASSGTLIFQGIVALASTGNQTTDSGQSLRMRCDSGVNGVLRVYSGTQRVMRSGANILPFNLSLNSGAAGDDLPLAPPGAQLNLIPDGQDHAVIMYAKIFAQDFKALPGGFYSASTTLTVEY